MKNFDHKVAVITGAASGLGRELARIAGGLGMRLVLADVQAQALHLIKDELQNHGVKVIAVQCDVRHADQVQTLADVTMQAFGVVHLLINNAGVGTGGLIWEATQADWEWVLGVNLWGVIHGIRIFTPLMLASAQADADYRGHIVNTASVAGLVNAPNLGAYNVSKHAVVSLSETLYHDLNLVDAPIGTSVLCPYFVATGMNDSAKNRPVDLPVSPPTASQTASDALIQQAMQSANLSAREVAERCFCGIRDEQFYIFPHPFVIDAIQQQAAQIASQQNPADPYQALPAVRKALRAAINPITTQTSNMPHMPHMLQTQKNDEPSFQLKVGDWVTLRVDAESIRRDVFINEQQIPEDMEWDDMDKDCLHAVVYDANDQAIGTGRLLPDGHIGRMAVRRVARGKGIGDAILRRLITVARQRGDRVVRLNAQLVAQGFYAKAGFVAEGELFDDAGIPHIVMVLRF